MVSSVQVLIKIEQNLTQREQNWRLCDTYT